MEIKSAGAPRTPQPRTTQDLPAAVDALSALAHESRLSVFRLLVQAGPSGMTVGEIGARLDIPGATLTHHLNQLKGASMVSAERNGRQIRMRANYRRMNDLLAYLYQNCCQGSAEGTGERLCEDGDCRHDAQRPGSSSVNPEQTS